MKQSREKVLSYVNNHRTPVAIGQVASGVGITYQAARKQLHKLTSAGAIVRPSRGEYAGKSIGRLQTAHPWSGDVQAKLAELTQQRDEIDDKISALHMAMSILGMKLRKPRGTKITDEQWATIGQKVQ